MEGTAPAKVGAAMNDREFVAYLDDHLAGSEAGLSAVRRLRRYEHLSEAMTEFETKILEEQDILRGAIESLGGTIPPGVVTRAIGLSSSVVIWARNLLIPQPAPMLVEDLEALAVGIWGKRLLWGAIARRAGVDPRLADVPVERLAESAEQQEIEVLRLRDDAIAPVET
jgi:hypothetical protein